MRSKLLLCLVCGLSMTVLAKEPKAYGTGKLVQMDSVQCGMTQKNAQSFAGELFATDAGTKKTQEVLCPEYVLQSEHVIYRIRPRDDKHPVLLPVGEQAQFRLQNDKMLLRVESVGSKEREYIVISMTPRSDGSTADNSSFHLNHLQ